MSTADETRDETPPEKPARRRRAAGSKPKRTSRFERRAEKAEKTIRDLIRLGKPELDVDGMSFLEVVDRDVKAWGQFLAQCGEWFSPFGDLVDLLFGHPLSILLQLAPSYRAGRRDLRDRRERRRLEAESAEQPEDGMAADGLPDVEPDVFSDPSPSEPELV